MRRGKKQRLLCTLGICCFLLLAGCGSDTGERLVAMGRYVEEELPLPAELKSLYHLGVTSEGRLLLAGKTQAEEWAAWVSEDGGESWQNQQNGWIVYLDQWDVNEITVDEQDRIWVSTYDGEKLYCIDGISIAEWDLKHQNDEDVLGQDLLVNHDRAAVSYGYGAVYGEDGSLLLSADGDYFLGEGDFFLTESRYGVAGTDGLRLFDLANGRQIQEIPFQKDLVAVQEIDFFDFDSRRTLVAAGPEAGVYSYCNESGIYRVSEDGVLHERILSGDLTSLGRPAVSAKKLLVTEDSYYIYAVDADSVPWQLKNPVLLRYRFDETVAAVADSQLRVYSLHDAPTVREAAALFQREYPDVRVSYEVGLTGLNQQEASDAVRLLTTEILSGKGPDVLVLDGLNGEDYMEKGVLADLQGLLSEDTLKSLLPNLSAAYCVQDGTYAVPARFTVLMALADPQADEALAAPDQFVELLESLASPQLGTPPDSLFELLYQMYGNAWFMEDGTLNEEAAAEGLMHIKAVMALYQGVDESQIWDTSGDFRAGAIGWTAGWTPVYINRFSALNQLMGPYTALLEQEGSFAAYPDPDGGKLLPQTVIGIYAESEKKELAAAFLEIMLSDRIQALTLGDGMPVVETALYGSLDSPHEDGYQRFGVSFSDGFAGGEEKGLTIPLYWPDELYFTEFIDGLMTLEVDTGTGATVDIIVAQEAESYLSGGRSLEDTVTSLRQKLDLYLAE